MDRMGKVSLTWEDIRNSLFFPGNVSLVDLRYDPVLRKIEFFLSSPDMPERREAAYPVSVAPRYLTHHYKSGPHDEEEFMGWVY